MPLHVTSTMRTSQIHRGGLVNRLAQTSVDREGPVLIVTAKIQRPQVASRLRRGPLLLHDPRASSLSAPKACESRSRNSIGVQSQCPEPD